VFGTTGSKRQLMNKTRMWWCTTSSMAAAQAAVRCICMQRLGADALCI
jgi:hypothetical protein